MSFVYHRVPENMVGEILYPMNRLNEVSGKLYKLYKDGYEGREILLKREIPYLNCLWNDVLHCLPLHPKTVITAMKQEGVNNPEIQKFKYFQIDTDKDIDIEKAVVYFRNGSNDIEFKRAKDVSLKKLSSVPDIARQNYRDVVRTGEPLFPYHGIPHFLYEGAIDTKGLDIISLGSFD